MNSDILVKLYYALIYPFLTYDLISWGNTYSLTNQSLTVYFTQESNASDDFHEHSSLIFKHSNIVKLPDLVFLNIAVSCINFTVDVYHLFDTFFS